MKITNEAEVPPGGWWYEEDETGYRMVTYDLMSLRKQIEAHRRANDLDLSDGWWEVVQMEMCLRPGMAETHCPEDNVLRPKREFSGVQRNAPLRFFRALREWHKTKGYGKGFFPKVDRKEAIRRAQICVDCPKNTDEIPGCPGCSGIIRWLKEFLTPNDKTGYEAQIDFCEVCGCSLEIKAWLPPETLRAISERTRVYPDHCWIAEAEKDTGDDSDH